MRREIQEATTRIVRTVLPTVSVIVVVVLTASCVSSGFEKEYRLFRQIKPGMTEEHVVELLGQPYKTYEKSTAPADYYVKGYSFKQREITHKVLIYVRIEPICYVYINREGVVEDVFVGGS